MSRSQFSALGFRLWAFGVLLAALTLPVFAQQSDNEHKKLDIQSSVGDLHIGEDADAKKIGLPLYPGARPKIDNNNQARANLSLLTEAFGLTLLVASYESGDAQGKIVDFYRDKLKKYGKVLECHTHKHGGDTDVHEDKDSENKQLTCEGDNSGPIVELKAGTEENQHMVAVEPSDSGKGSSIALLYIRTRGKRGEI